ncbi:MAG: amidohydrolase family protein [Roseivirga sp.]|nr:amidohydrolase family protein [Roseivirga sp.]
MKNIRRLQIVSVLSIILTIIVVSCKEVVTYDLAITDVQVFDAYTGEVNTDKTILISGDEIAAIIDKNDGFKTRETIEGKGRLVSPGFIDTHIHFGDLYGDYDEAPEYLVSDSVELYQQKLSDTFLKYGTTTVAVMGQPEKWLEETIHWQKNAKADMPNVLVTGGAIISDEERPPYGGHVEVMNPEDARKLVRKYHEKGVKHIKLYWRLRLPEMEAAVDEAQTLGLNIFGHIDFNLVGIPAVMDLGVKHFEHVMTVSNDAFGMSQYYGQLNNLMEEHYPGIEAYFPYLLEQMQMVEDTPELRDKRDGLIQNMIEKEATLSTTIHLFGTVVKRTFFNSYITNYYADQNPDLNEAQLERLNKAFDTFMAYIKAAHDQGLKLRIGTDCKEGGQAALSEMLLLSEAGFPMSDILRIATLNGAEALQIDADSGSITAGKKADLILFKNNPFENSKALLDEKTVIKSGKVYN